MHHQSQQKGDRNRKGFRNGLKNEVKKLFSIRNNLLIHISKVLHSELSYKLHSIGFDILDDMTA